MLLEDHSRWQIDSKNNPRWQIKQLPRKPPLIKIMDEKYYKDHYLKENFKRTKIKCQFIYRN